MAKREKKTPRKVGLLWKILSVLVVLLVIYDIQNPDMIEGLVGKIQSHFTVEEVEQLGIGVYEIVSMEDLEQIEESKESLMGQNVRVVGQVELVKDGEIKFLNKSRSVVAYVEGIESESIYPGTYVEVCGVVGERMSIRRGVTLEQSWVSKKGGEAYIEASHQEADKEMEEAIEEEKRREMLSESISPYNYPEYVEAPKKYEGNVVRVSGEVTEVRDYEEMRHYYVSGKDGGYFKRLSSEETVVVDIKVEEGVRVEKGQHLSVVGVFTGVSGFDRVYLQRQEQLPMVRMEYIE